MTLSSHLLGLGSNVGASSRLSQASVCTDDSADSVSLSTPLDASPCAPVSATFPIITVVREETSTMPSRPHIPAIATTAASTRRRRILMAQTALWPAGSGTPSASLSVSPRMHSAGVPTDRSAHDTQTLWPRIKKLVSNRPCRRETPPLPPMDHMSGIPTKHSNARHRAATPKKPTAGPRNTRWFGSNKARVGPSH